MDDFRVKIGFLDHPKTVKLRRKLGSEAVECFLRLWEYCSISGNGRTNGDLRGMTNEDIAIAAKWPGKEEDFVRALADVGFLDKKNKGWMIHQWEEHNPYATGHEGRSKSAQKAVHSRWVKNNKYHQRTEWCDTDCLLIAHASHTSRIRTVSKSDTPDPSPATGSRIRIPDPVPVLQTWPDAISSISDLELAISDWGWSAVGMSPTMIKRARRIVSGGEIDKPEFDHARKKTAEKAEGDPDLDHLPYFLAIIEGERKRAALEDQKPIYPKREPRQQPERTGAWAKEFNPDDDED